MVEEEDRGNGKGPGVGSEVRKRVCREWTEWCGEGGGGGLN